MARRLLPALWIVIALLAIIQIGRLSVFMFDASRTWGSTIPDPRAISHQCLSAYIQAADLARRGETNIYDTKFYPAFSWRPGKEPPTLDSPVFGLSKYLQDPYQYPPQFLILPRAALAMTNNFLTIRTAWYLIQIMAVILAVLLAARWIGGKQRSLVALLLPALLASMPVMLNLQFGQFHVMAVILATAGMVSFQHKKSALGGALLSFSILSKIFPGILLIYLASRKQWREILWTSLFVLIFTILGMLIIGWLPFQAFLSFELPRLINEQAFSFSKTPGIPLFFVSRNYSIEGWINRLHLFGVPGITAGLQQFVGWIYSLLLVWLAWHSGRQEKRSRLINLQIWIALLSLASFRTPLAPSGYVVVPSLFLLMLLAPEIQGRKRYAVAMIFVWIIIMGIPPLPDLPELVFDLISQTILIALNVWVLIRVRREFERVDLGRVQVENVLC